MGKYKVKYYLRNAKTKRDKIDKSIEVEIDDEKFKGCFNNEDQCKVAARYVDDNNNTDIWEVVVYQVTKIKDNSGGIFSLFGN